MASASTTLFVLAHQDDELAFAPVIARLGRQGAAIRLLYLTDGGAGRAAPARRCAETTRALASLGVAQADIRFLGCAQGIPDGSLLAHLEEAFRAVETATEDLVDLGDIYTLAWEGGHPDHDATHVVAMALAAARGCLDRLWQVAFYRAADRGPPWFSLFAPLPDNGPVEHVPLAPDERRLRAMLMRFYPSQWLTFLGLGPGIAWNALTARTLSRQRGQLSRLGQRPTAGRLLYEQRNGVSFEQFSATATAFLAAQGASGQGDRQAMSHAPAAALGKAG